ncbi:norbelladine synthase-like [Tasmannia lanceolata]|uniref:norbelladine synthase-like n=1 Tax=Tasmannia lanceolata TaxID=3420 RepID=UPI0040644984
MSQEISRGEETKEKMHGELLHELEVGLPDGVVWEVYGTLELANLVGKLLPNIIEKIELVEGDGGVGTVLLLTFPKGTPGLTSYKEKFVMIDNEKRVKDVDVVEGGYLDLGFSLFQIRLEIIEKDVDSSIIRSTIFYELDDEHASNASLVNIGALATVAQVIAKHLTDKKDNA